MKPLEFKYKLGMSYKAATNRMLVRRLMETVKTKNATVNVSQDCWRYQKISLDFAC
jgi:hypothetical protein